MKVGWFLVALGIMTAGTIAISSAASVDGPKRDTPLITGTGRPFVDEFRQLNPEIWSISHGWSNGAYVVNDWQRSQSVIDNGLSLKLENMTITEKRYSSGELQSRATYGHGYYEIIMKAAKGSGIISGFFTYTGPYFGKNWNEIDIEILGRNTREASLTYFYQGKPRSHTVKLEFDAAQGFHHYAFDWQPEYIRWYIDGILVHEERGEVHPLPNEAQKLMVHLWGTDTIRDWAGPFDSDATPAKMEIRCIAYSHIRPPADKCNLN